MDNLTLVLPLLGWKTAVRTAFSQELFCRIMGYALKLRAAAAPATQEMQPQEPEQDAVTSHLSSLHLSMASTPGRQITRRPYSAQQLNLACSKPFTHSGLPCADCLAHSTYPADNKSIKLRRK